MNMQLLTEILDKLNRLPVGTCGTLRELCGEKLWKQLPSPRTQARLIAREAKNLECLYKNDCNALVYRVIS